MSIFSSLFKKSDEEQQRQKAEAFYTDTQTLSLPANFAQTVM